MEKQLDNLVEEQWFSVGELLHNDLFNEHQQKSLLEIIVANYSQPVRAYHTLQHIYSLLMMAKMYRSVISDYLSVLLAIFFHDIIYDPKARDNEEKSAAFFSQLMGPFVEPQRLQKVVSYILETKTHSVLLSADADLKFFIDMDLSILGSERQLYKLYAAQIRTEYEHVPEEIYCRERAKFLRLFLEKCDVIYATTVFQDLFESQARLNLVWECHQLEAGNTIIP
jgi:predicted metal-dependent HD superfamily phosphohydrolase